MTKFADLDTLTNYIRERERIRQAKESGMPAPWTDDPVLRAHRFCNVSREDDRITRWIAANWRIPHADDPDLWFAMVVARSVNRIESLAAIGYPNPWDPERYVSIMEERMARKEAYGGAYITTTSGIVPGQSKPRYQVERILNPLLRSEWTIRRLRPQKGQTLAEYAALLSQEYGFKGFMAAQVVADLKYVEPLLSAVDWHDWAASGPGSRRGLHRLLDQSPSSKIDVSWPEYKWLTTMRALRAELAERGVDLHLQDIEHCVCEYDKLLRARSGQGKLRPYSPMN